jgi:pimeloyl-ACP methyl ester carboxylesterase
MPDGPLTVEAMADDAAGVLRALDIPSAHVAGFSGGSIIAQELAPRHPQLVRSLVLQSTWPAPGPYLRKWGQFVRWLVEVAPSERAFLEEFFLDIYTPARTTTAPCLPVPTRRPARATQTRPVKPISCSTKARRRSASTSAGLRSTERCWPATSISRPRARRARSW